MNQNLPLAEIDALFEQLLALPEAQREACLVQIAAANANLARSLRRLLELAQASDTRGLRAIGEAALGDCDDAAAPQIPGYRIERELGRGGMGTVYEAHRDLGGIEQPVAVKVLRRALLGEDELRRFLTEQRILARLSHPNITGLLDAGSIDGRPWMALERIEGQPIDRALSPPAPITAVLDAVVQIADALQLAHAHLVVHRDIKPDNVLVDAEGRIKLIDFGIAKLLVEELGEHATQTGAAPLTLRYASPEQLLGRPVGVPSDIYQLGLLMYWQLTGAWPWDESAQQLPTQRTQPEIEPVAPSERVDEAARKRALRGDLDCIVLR
jgi:serine/threonine-protein kinase